MDPPGDHDGDEKRKLLKGSSSAHPPRRGSKVGSRYVTLLLVLSFICFATTFLTYQRILSPYVEVMTASIDQPLPNDDLSTKPAVDDKQQFLEDDNLSNKPAVVNDMHEEFKPTAFHKHIQQRQSNYVHHNDITHSSKSTFGTGENSNVRISFQLHDREVVPINNTFNPYVTCRKGMIFQGRGIRRRPTKEVRKGVLPPSLMSVSQSDDLPREGRVLDFTATISTNLKILQIGDSVGVQLAQTFDEMVGCRNSNVTGAGSNGTGFCRPRVVFAEAWEGHDSRSILFPTIGGGVSAMWRMTALLSKANEGKPPANSHGGGWSMGEVVNFLHYYTPLNETPLNERNRSKSEEAEDIVPEIVQKFDVVVYRVMHGWMKSEEITHDRLVEAVELSHKLLGAETVVLMTIPFTNNVLTVEDMSVVNHINADIRGIAQGWHLRNSTGVKHVLVQEYGTYHNHIIWSNAKDIGYNVSAPLTMTDEMFDTEGPTFLYDRLQISGQWKPSIAQVCSEQNWLRTERAKCDRNYLISDGMHICPETLATRYGVAVACLIGCVYNRKSDNQQQHDEINLRACERECNEQFMSVMPVDESWIDSNTELASFPTATS